MGSNCRLDDFSNERRVRSYASSSLRAIISLSLFFCTAAIGAGPNDFLACWSFNETAGQIVHDSSANGFSGQVHGAAWGRGILANGLALDGLDDYVEITDSNDYPDLMGELAIGTISVWFKFNSIPLDNTIHPIFYLGDGIGGSGNSSLIIEIGHFNSQNYKLYFTILTSNLQKPLFCFDSRVNLELDTWYHFAAVVGVDYNTGYLNGSEMTSRKYNFGGPTDSCFFADVDDKRVCWLGKGFLSSIPATNHFDGMIDEIRIYDRPLSSDEIRGYYEGQLATHSRILDGLPKTIVVNGYSTSSLWPNLLQQKLDDYFGSRVIEVVKAIKGGTPIAKWIDVETAQRSQSWLDILQPQLQRDGLVIVLAQQSLQWVFDTDRSIGIRDEFDTERIQQGADAIETYVEALIDDGADIVLFATHIYKYSMEPEIHNEIYALEQALGRNISQLEAGPDVWTPMQAAWPEAFASDKVHPNDDGAEIMAQYWFEAILARDAPWDIDSNRTIDFVDMSILSRYWQQSNCILTDWCGNADFDRDGFVTFSDLLRISHNWLGQTLPH